MQKLLLTLCVPVLLAACGKDGTPAPPTDAPANIVLDKPTAGFVYPNSSVITVEGTATDNNGLKKVRLEIRHKTNGTVYNSQEVTLANIGFHFFHWTWTVASITGPTNAVVRIITTDRFDYQTTKDLDIQLDN